MQKGSGNLVDSAELQKPWFRIIFLIRAADAVVLAVAVSVAAAVVAAVAEAQYQ